MRDPTHTNLEEAAKDHANTIPTETMTAKDSVNMYIITIETAITAPMAVNNRAKASMKIDSNTYNKATVKETTATSQRNKSPHSFNNNLPTTQVSFKQPPLPQHFFFSPSSISSLYWYIHKKYRGE